MEDDIDVPKQDPFRAEYAKSGRSKCKACKNNIETAELRLSIRTPSTFFDGLQDNWHHFDCFWKKAKSCNSTGDIGYFGTLRFEDQERIKKMIASRAGTSESASQFRIEYAASSRSKCVKCIELIKKGEIRFGTMTSDSEQAMRFGPYFSWRHMECFAADREELRFTDAARAIAGFGDLERDHQEQVKKLLPALAKKRKNASEVKDEAKPSKVSKANDDKKGSKSKSEDRKKDKEQEELKKQSKAYFKIRDGLRLAFEEKKLTKQDMVDLLVENGQDVPEGISALYDPLSDVMTFGALKRCDVCKNGQYKFKNDGYVCQGALTEFSACKNVNNKPARVPFKISKSMKSKFEDLPFLAKYKMDKVITRIIPKIEKSSAETNASKPATEPTPIPTSHKVLKVVKEPLKGFKFLVDAEFEDKPKIAQTITKFGGELRHSLTSRSKCAAIVASKGTLEKGKASWCQIAEDLKIPVVTPKWVEKIKEKDYFLDKEMAKYQIADWIKPDEIKLHLEIVNPSFKEKKITEEEKQKVRNKEKYAIEEKKVKLKMKDGAVVDPDAIDEDTEEKLEDIGHVYKEGQQFFNFVLSKVDVEKGRNSYYKCQIIQSDTGNRFWVYRAWGRLGTTRGNNKTESCDSLEAAMTIFNEVYSEKTGNHWGMPFKKLPNFYVLLDIRFDNEKKEEQIDLKPDMKMSKLPMPVQQLICRIFDVSNMNRTMLEFELDLEKMPLGKLSRKQILDAYSVLSDAAKLVEAEDKSSQTHKRLVIDATNRFFSLIPHNFGDKNTPLLKELDFIRSKIEMLESLMELELAYELLQETDKDEKSPIDAHYKALRCAIDPLEKNSKLWKILEKYLTNTHAPTHEDYTLELLNIYSVGRKDEGSRYKKFSKLHNRMLLWHGSRTSNYAGILSQGLRIAPKEAPVTGYMFGKGIYFADMVSKSANYCYPTGDNVGLLMLCEVALGDMHELKSANDRLMTAPNGKHSVKGLGGTIPDPEEKIDLPTGAVVPYGKPKESKVKSDLLYNEYIVYDVAQVNINYLLEVKFHYKRGRGH